MHFYQTRLQILWIIGENVWSQMLLFQKEKPVRMDRSVPEAALQGRLGILQGGSWSRMEVSLAGTLLSPTPLKDSRGRGSRL